MCGNEYLPVKFLGSKLHCFRKDRNSVRVKRGFRLIEKRDGKTARGIAKEGCQQSQALQMPIRYAGSLNWLATSLFNEIRGDTICADLFENQFPERIREGLSHEINNRLIPVIERTT